MYRYKITFKNGTEVEVESKFLSLSTLEGILNEHQPYISIGDRVLAREEVLLVEQLVIMEG